MSRSLSDYLEHILQAATEARDFVAGMSNDGFLADKRTQNAVVMSLVVIGEAATQIMERYPCFVEQHPEIAWRGMRGMRNRIAHGYFEINLELVWTTVQSALPELLEHLIDMQDEAGKATDEDRQP